MVAPHKLIKQRHGSHREGQEEECPEDGQQGVSQPPIFFNCSRMHKALRMACSQSGTDAWVGVCNWIGNRAFCFMLSVRLVGGCCFPGLGSQGLEFSFGDVASKDF